MQPGTIILQNFQEFLGGCPWLCFRAPCAILATHEPACIVALLGRIEVLTGQGYWAAGFLSYEAARAFDPAYRVKAPVPGLPLVWFGIYEGVEALDEFPAATGNYQFTPWQPALAREEFATHIERIRQYIAAGDTYQVNFTFPLHARFTGDAGALFHALHHAQQGSHGALVVTPDYDLVSASPELFFAQSGEVVITRPMKGTAPRGRWAEESARHAAMLRASEKERAENVMIVDLLRNDLGRVARPGTVEVTRLFEVEEYATVLQMTSTIQARTAAHPVATLKALFPCGSITGAPKVRTMELITELESGPRGIYTGAIGWMGPKRRACFNVAIRTVAIERASGAATYGVGSGVTWSSCAAGEYEECLVKARVLDARSVAFELLETLLWEPAQGFFLLEEHLARLTASARYFERPDAEGEVRTALAEAVRGHEGETLKVRLLVNGAGRARAEAFPIAFAPAGQVMRVGLTAEPVNSQDCFLFHKTTRREVYERARQGRSGLDDVILWNERDEVTESTIANIVVDLGDGALLTPARECGLLTGVFRDSLIRQGRIKEGIIPRCMLGRARQIWLINSVRRWMPVQFIPDAE